jgi:CheY-like chemotaxis protein
MTIVESTVCDNRRQPSRSRRRKRGGPRLLWVDDDANLTASFTRGLRKKGFDVIPASDGMQGYWLALTAKPHAIITDLRMPRWDGGELIDCLLSNSVTASVPLIVLSGYVTADSRRRLERRGVAAVLDKPIQPKTLIDTLRRLTSAPGLS